MSDDLEALSERLRTLENQIQQSWALNTKDTYEAAVEAEVKNDLRIYLAMAIIIASIMLLVAGYFIVRFSVNASLAKTHEELEAKYEAALVEQKTKFEWNRQHNIGVNQKYLSELYQSSDLETRKKQKNTVKLLQEAKRYLLEAVKTDPTKAATYWELGEVIYRMPLTFGLKGCVDESEGLAMYIKASNKYTNEEILSGYRGGCYERISEIYLKQASRSKDKNDKEKLEQLARDMWRKANEDFVKSKEEIDENMKEDMQKLQYQFK